MTVRIGSRIQTLRILSAYAYLSVVPLACLQELGIPMDRLHDGVRHDKGLE